MLDLSTIGVALRWWLVGSSRTGEFIVYTGISFVDMLVNAVKAFNAVCVLLYEGSTLWLKDIYDYFCVVQETIRTASDYSVHMLSLLVAAAARVVWAPFSLIAAVLTSIRELLLLLGSSCLFLLSLPPLFLFYLADSVLHAFKVLRSFTLHVGERLTEHAADIETLEVLTGLVVGCGLMIIAVNGIRLLVYWYFMFKTRMYRRFLTWAGTTWRRVKRRMTIARRRQGQDNYKLQETELCIVCFGKARSVCLLPCRHLCLCTNCTQLLSHPLRCPLCRQLADDLIHVYL
ncbi:uncharacterized protein LOC124175376 [Neodiprion fabricii]|uniref:uncharacterized protein LOC124175376 n=1 Tax=Neodiprion fabricii TaxID=2872261 RepID=UPI001ED92EEB|nr:uncharacterized protein LOC124175376 [Neodiprion fabricii]